jgi:hypothetical protein
MNPNAPCKDCEVRYVGCHADCEDYLVFKKHFPVSKKDDALNFIVEGCDKRKRKYCKDRGTRKSSYYG